MWHVSSRSGAVWQLCELLYACYLLRAKFHYTDTDTDFFEAKQNRTDPTEFRHKKSPCPCPCRARVRARVVEVSYYLLLNPALSVLW